MNERRRLKWGCFIPFGLAFVLFLIIILRADATKYVLWEQYQKIELGMTEDEVQALLGQPTLEDYTGGGFGPHDCVWVQVNERIIIVFGFVGPGPIQKWGVRERRYYPRTLWEKSGISSFR